MKIRLAAIAKDEGAYLPEWIYWHLKEGFDDIYICINNSQDNSETSVQNIAKKHPVTIKSIDSENCYGFNDDLIDPHFLKKNPLQSKIYADIYSSSYHEGYSHVMFLDIDEFLSSGGKGIHRLLTEHEQDGVILFNWFNISGEEESFSCTGMTIKGEKSPFTKYVLKTGLADIKFISTHNIKTTQSTKRLFGRQITKDNSNYVKDSGWTDSAFIVHRHLRSKPEYLSLLSRGDTWDNSLIGLKNNRHGWSNVGKHTVSLPYLNLHSYKEGIKNFLDDCGIQSLVTKDQEYVLARATKTEDLVNKIQSLNRDLDRVLAGTNLQHIDRGLKYTIKRLIYRVLVKKNINNYF